MPTATPSAETWTEAHRQLIENVRCQGFTPKDDRAAFVFAGRKRVTLPAYIPYIGPDYFDHRPRILCYAINQNLSRHAGWTEEWATRWGNDIDLAIDRLNRAAAAGKALPIKPYAEGFIPLVAAMVLARFPLGAPQKCLPVVDRVIAATNFVKFSTSESASSATIPSSWWSECGRRYAIAEILILRPDLVVGFGHRTAAEIRRVLKELPQDKPGPRLLHCPFPGRIPSSKARPLSPQERQVWTEGILPLADRLQRPPANTYHQWRMLRFPGYFVDAVGRWAAEAPFPC